MNQQERNEQARAHRAEKAFISQEAEHLDIASTKLRRAIFLTPGDERSAILNEVAALADNTAKVLKERA